MYGKQYEVGKVCTLVKIFETICFGVQKATNYIYLFQTKILVSGKTFFAKIKKGCFHLQDSALFRYLAVTTHIQITMGKSTHFIGQPTPQASQMDGQTPDH